jgi:hypothetical protein
VIVVVSLITEEIRILVMFRMNREFMEDMWSSYPDTPLSESKRDEEKDLFETRKKIICLQGLTFDRIQKFFLLGLTVWFH